MYLSKSVVKSDNNAKVKHNNNPPVECNDNSAKEFDENFMESVVDQNIININVGDTFYSWEIAETHLNQYARAPHTFTAEIRQHAQKKVKYESEFKKAKKALNLALDMGCKNEFINIIDSFINQKKSDISITNIENIENLYILNPLIVKQHRRLPNKYIKSLTENNSYNSTKTSISVINSVDPNLYICNVSKTTIQQMQNLQYLFELTTRTSFHTLNNNSNNQADTLFDSSSIGATQDIKENAVKQKYICKTCENPGHNSRKCN
ncbi:21571_t:CDS:2, partial [Cetraspora pellucida]